MGANEKLQSLPHDEQPELEMARRACAFREEMQRRLDIRRA